MVVVMEEPCFPRGGNTRKSAVAREKRKNNSDVLFKEPSLSKKKKKKPLKGGIQDDDDSDDDFDDQRQSKQSQTEKDEEEDVDLPLQVKAAEQLSFQHLREGMVVLGRIQEIRDMELLVSLPGRLQAYVPITNISDPYTLALKDIAANDSPESEEVKSLKEMFVYGQVIQCSIVEIALDGSRRILATLNPTNLNKDLSASSIYKDMVLMGAVRSIEDHGYVVDMGIKNMRAFLRKDESSDLSPGLGQLIRLSVKKISQDGSTCTLQLSTQTAKLTVDDDFTLNSLIPGTILNVTVDKLIPGGIQVAFGRFKGIVHEQHTMTASVTTNKYSPGEKLTATVLYIMPLINAPYLSLKPELQVLKSDENQAKYKLTLGQILDNARVLSSSSAGSFVSLTKGCRGFVPLRHLQDTVPGADIIDAKLPINAQRRVRVLQYAVMDGIYICTMKKSLLKQAALRYEDFKVGQTVEGTVLGLQDVHSGTLKGKGVKVNIGRNLEGFIMPMHIADDPRLKRPELKFKPGDAITTRVLHVEPERKKVFLTHKKTLLESDGSLITCLDDAKPGQVVYGTVVMVCNKGLLVTFYGDAKGWVPVAKLSLEYIESPAASFRIGQLVKCQVEHVNLIKQRIYLTLNIDAHAAKGKGMGGNEAAPISELVESNFPAFGLVSCVVNDVMGSEAGVRVTVVPSSTTAFIPQSHLSDDPGLTALLLATLKKGQTLDDCVVYVRHPSLILSRKPSLIKLAQDQNVPQSRAHVTSNLLLPVVIVDNTKLVVKVHIPCLTAKVTGVIKKQGLPLGVDFKTGQTLLVKVVENDVTKEEVSLTTVLKHEERQEAELSRLTQFVEGTEKVKSCAKDLHGKLAYLSGIKRGQSVAGKVSLMTQNVIEVELENNVKGILPSYHTPGHGLKLGDLVAGVVLDVCMIDQLVYLTLRKKLVQEFSKPLDKQSFEVKVNQSYPGLIVVGDPHYLLVQLHCAGKPLAYVPSRPLVSRPSLSVFGKSGDRVTVIVKQSIAGTILAVLEESKRAKKRNRTTSQSSISDAGSPSKKKGKDEARVPSGLEVLGQNQPEKRKSPRLNNPLAGNGMSIQAEETKAEHEVTSEKGLSKKKKKNKKKSKAKNEPESKHPTEAQVPSHSAAPDLSRLNVSQGFSFDENDWSVLPSLTRPTAADDSDSEEDETVPLATRQRRSRMEEEKKVAQLEKALAKPGRLPQSSDDYDRLVLAHPNSSLHWLQYMAFYLQATEVEKARGVARRALRTIEYREEGEKFNIWTALLNLENLYGSVESVEAVVQEAITYNEPVKVYMQLAKIYTESGKIELADETFNLLLKKFKHNKDVWLTAFVFNFKRQKPDVARNQLQRALQSLDKREHVDLLSRFAQLECKLGEIERAKTMFDTLLASYPKRVDLWMVYLDALVRAGDTSGARQVMERAITLQLPAKKMKSLFQKFLTFEQTHGDEERQEYVKRKALEFVNSKMGSEDA